MDEFEKRNLLFYLFVLLLQYLVQKAESNGAFVDEKKCGTLFSQGSLEEDSFILKDFDQSVNLRKDYRTYVSGWWSTSSLKVEDGCSMTICSETYFNGNCGIWTGSDRYKSPVPSPNSVNCTCSRVCNCDNIYLPLSEDYCGRAYVSSGGCNVCDGQYIQLYNGTSLEIAEKHRDSVNAIVVQSGCTLTTWTEKSQSGTKSVLKGTTPVYQGRIQSYECTCDKTKHVPANKSSIYPSTINLPFRKEELLNLFSENVAVIHHPGMLVSIKSTENLRSSKNAYILLIGAAHLIWWSPRNARPETPFGEAKIPVNLDNVGIFGTSLRVIIADFAGDNQNQGGSEDARWAASLDEYLSNHEELASVVPNAVVILHYPLDEDTSAANSRFQRKLRLVNAIRPLVVDESYSNLIFVVWIGRGLSSETKLAEIEAVIEEQFNFPKPTVVIPSGHEDIKDPKINGYWKLANGEYAPRNLLEKLKIICNKAGDPLGRAIFNAAFPEEKLHKLKSIISNKTELVIPTHPKVEYYKKLLSNSLPNSRLYESFLKRRAERQVYISNGIKEALEKKHQEENDNILSRSRTTDQVTLQNEFTNASIQQQVHDFEKIFEARMQNLMERFQQKMLTIMDKEKLTRKADLESLKKEILGKINIKLDKIFE